MQHKPKPILIILDFIFSAFLTFIVICIVLFLICSIAGEDEIDFLKEAFYFVIAVSIVFAAYVVFYQQNIVIDVTENSVRFLRWDKEYRCFPLEKYRFRGQIHTLRYLGIPLVSKHLHVIPITGKSKKYNCNNISKKQFHEILSYIANTQKSQAKQL